MTKKRTCYPVVELDKEMLRKVLAKLECFEIVASDSAFGRKGKLSQLASGYVSISFAAELMQYSRYQLLQLVKQGKIPVYAPEGLKDHVMVMDLWDYAVDLAEQRKVLSAGKPVVHVALEATCQLLKPHVT